MKGYNRTGNSHSDGLKAEQNLTKWLNEYFKDSKNKNKFINILKSMGVELKNTNILFKHQGGTKTIADIVENSNQWKISVKNKKTKNGKIAGTFDLLNTTDFSTIISKKNKNFWSIVDEFNNYKISQRKKQLLNNDKNIITETRLHIFSLFKKLLNTITGEDIYNMLEKIINKKATFELVSLGFEDRNSALQKVYILDNKWLEEETKKIDLKYKYGNEKGSEFIHNLNKEDELLRIRVSTNNGISALLGIGGKTQSGKTKNTNSTLVLKLQVDKVGKVLSKYGYELKE